MACLEEGFVVEDGVSLDWDVRSVSVAAPERAGGRELPPLTVQPNAGGTVFFHDLYQRGGYDRDHCLVWSTSPAAQSVLEVAEYHHRDPNPKCIQLHLPDSIHGRVSQGRYGDAVLFTVVTTTAQVFTFVLERNLPTQPALDRFDANAHSEISLDFILQELGTPNSHAFIGDYWLVSGSSGTTIAIRSADLVAGNLNVYSRFSTAAVPFLASLREKPQERCATCVIALPLPDSNNIAGILHANGKLNICDVARQRQLGSFKCRLDFQDGEFPTTATQMSLFKPTSGASNIVNIAIQFHRNDGVYLSSHVVLWTLEFKITPSGAMSIARSESLSEVPHQRMGSRNGGDVSMASNGEDGGGLMPFEYEDVGDVAGCAEHDGRLWLLLTKYGKARLYGIEVDEGADERVGVAATAWLQEDEMASLFPTPPDAPAAEEMLAEAVDGELSKRGVHSTTQRSAFVEHVKQQLLLPAVLCRKSLHAMLCSHGVRRDAQRIQQATTSELSQLISDAAVLATSESEASRRPLFAHQVVAQTYYNMWMQNHYAVGLTALPNGGLALVRAGPMLCMLRVTLPYSSETVLRAYRLGLSAHDARHAGHAGADGAAHAVQALHHLHCCLPLTLWNSFSSAVLSGGDAMQQILPAYMTVLQQGLPQHSSAMAAWRRLRRQHMAALQHALHDGESLLRCVETLMQGMRAVLNDAAHDAVSRPEVPRFGGGMGATAGSSFGGTGAQLLCAMAWRGADAYAQICRDVMLLCMLLRQSTHVTLTDSITDWLASAVPKVAVEWQAAAMAAWLLSARCAAAAQHSGSGGRGGFGWADTNDLMSRLALSRTSATAPHRRFVELPLATRLLPGFLVAYVYRRQADTAGHGAMEQLLANAPTFLLSFQLYLMVGDALVLDHARMQRSAACACLALFDADEFDALIPMRWLVAVNEACAGDHEASGDEGVGANHMFVTAFSHLARWKTSSNNNNSSSTGFVDATVDAMLRTAALLPKGGGDGVRAAVFGADGKPGLYERLTGHTPNSNPTAIEGVVEDVVRKHAELTQQLRYCEAMMLLLERARCASGALRMAHAAVQAQQHAAAFAAESSLPAEWLSSQAGRLWKFVFKYACEARQWRQAYEAAMANPVHEHVHEDIRQLVAALCDANELRVLCDLPFAGSRVEKDSRGQDKHVAVWEMAAKALETRAHHAAVNAQPCLYAVLYDACMRRNCFKAAAAAMLQYARRLEREAADEEDVLQRVAAALCCALTTLRLVPYPHNWLEDNFKPRPVSKHIAEMIGDEQNRDPNTPHNNGESESALMRIDDNNGRNELNNRSNGISNNSAHTRRSIVATVSCDDLQREYVVLRCKAALVGKRSAAELLCCDDETMVQMLVDAQLYESAHDVCYQIFTGEKRRMHLAAVVRALTGVCVAQQLQQSMDSTAQQDAIVRADAIEVFGGPQPSTSADEAVPEGLTSAEAWQLLRSFIEYDQQLHQPSQTHRQTDTVASPSASTTNVVAKQSTVGGSSRLIGGSGGTSSDGCGGCAHLHVVAAEKILSSSSAMQLPMWLVRTFLGDKPSLLPSSSACGMAGSDAASLLRCYIRHRRFNDALQLIASSFKAAIDQLSTTTVRSSFQLWFPHDTIETLRRHLTSSDREQLDALMRDYEDALLQQPLRAAAHH